MPAAGQGDSGDVPVLVVEGQAVQPPVRTVRSAAATPKRYQMLFRTAVLGPAERTRGCWHRSCLGTRVVPCGMAVSVPASVETLGSETGAPTIRDAHMAGSVLRGIGARQVLLFGSVAAGTARPGSDIDMVAVFDDLGDYSTRHNLESQLLAALDAVCGWDCDILVTDRVEWSVRSELATTVEAEIARSCQMLLDLPAAGPIDWHKQIVRPASDTQEATAELRVAARHLHIVSEYARGTRGERDARRARDNVRVEIARLDRMRVLCESSHSAAGAALRAYTKGVLRQRPSRGGEGGRFAAMVAELPQDKRAVLEASLRVAPSKMDQWEQAPGATLPSEVLESVTPALAADMAATALECCRFAARSITDALGPVQEARYLLEIVMYGGIAKPLARLRRGGPIAGVAYEMSGLNAPPVYENSAGSRLLRTLRRQPAATPK